MEILTTEHLEEIKSMTTGMVLALKELHKPLPNPIDEKIWYAGAVFLAEIPLKVKRILEEGSGEEFTGSEKCLICDFARFVVDHPTHHITTLSLKKLAEVVTILEKDIDKEISSGEKEENTVIEGMKMFTVTGNNSIN